MDRTAYNREQKARRRARTDDTARGHNADAILSALDALADRIADRIVRDLELWKTGIPWSEIADNRDPVPGPFGTRGTGPGIPGDLSARTSPADNADNDADNPVRADTFDSDHARSQIRGIADSLRADYDPPGPTRKDLE